MKPVRAKRSVADPKVFGIGFHKTGTSSLAQALRDLGYRVGGPNGIHDPNIADNVHEMALTVANQFDAFKDNPWPLLYQEVDDAFPGSRFILTVRPTGDWIDSVVNHFGDETTPMREWIYGVGSPRGNEQTYVDRYERHNREVTEYFRDRDGDLLVLDLANGDGWEQLCPFLGKRVPDVPFPRANTSADRENRVHTSRGRPWSRIFSKRLTRNR